VIDDGEMIADFFRFVFPDAGRAAVIADHAEHIRFVLLVMRERSVRETEPRRAESPRLARDRLCRKLSAKNRRFKDELGDRKEVGVAFDIEFALLGVIEAQHIDRRQIAACVVEEGVLSAGISGIDTVVLGSVYTVLPCRARVPGVECIVELGRRVGAPPCGLVENLPQMADRHFFVDTCVAAPFQADLRVREPVEVCHFAHKFIVKAHGIVRVLSGNGLVGDAVDVCVVTHLGERDNLIFFARFPRNEALNFRVVDIETDHLRGAPRRPP